jgi:glycosyltransferase involved in cell wall biosynthesis
MTATAAEGHRVLMVEEGGIGGVASYTDALAGAIAAAGWDVRLATGRDHATDRPAGVRVLPIFPYVRGRSAVGRLARALRLSRAINGAGHLAADAVLAGLARGADVVHVQGEEWPPLGAALALMLRASGRPFVYTPHNTFDRGGRSYTRAHDLIRGAAARMIVHCEYDRSTLPTWQAAKTVVIPHGEYGHLAQLAHGATTDADPASARARLGIGDGELVALLFGQLRPDKGVRDLLEAAAQVDGVRVLLAGEDHGALGEVAGLLRERRLRDRVIVRPGFVPAAQMGELFAAADVVVLPYHRASASGVLLLAYGFARPVLAYPVGGLPEYVVEGRTGWICDGADPAALTRGLRTVLAAGREQCRARGQDALRYSEERFAWEPIARRTIELYEQVLALR